MRSLASDLGLDSARMPRPRGGWRRSAWVGLAVLAGVFAGTVQAQVRDFDDLDDAVDRLALELVHEGRLEGNTVLVSARYFFERGTERSLRLSAHLAARFASTLGGREVEVVSGSERSGVMTLRGEWTIERESEHLHLSMEIKRLEIETDADGNEVARRRVVASEGGRVPLGSIDGQYLEPDLESHALYVVRKLEKGIERNFPAKPGRYRVHMEPLAVEDVAQPDRFRRRLVRYLRPAFADSRELMRVHSAENADGTLHGEIWGIGESVELGLWIVDRERQAEVAAVTVEMSVAEVMGSDAVLRLAARLAECAAHFGAERLGEAAGCYREVLERERGNREARAGLERIESRHVERARRAVGRGDLAAAEGYRGQLRELNPGHAQVMALKGEIEEAERRAEEEERRRVKERRIRELTPEMVVIEGGCFLMGSPQSETGRNDNERRHRVCVESFSIGKYEVTRGEYARFVRETGRATGDECWTFESGEAKVLFRT